MTDKQILAQKIKEVALLRGEFKLRSGKVSNHYFDKYRFESRPELLQKIAELMKPLIPAGTEILAGLEMGGIPIATALSLQTGLPCTFVRKKAKDYGTEKFAEGADIKNKKVLIIEDVITTGGQVLLSTDDLRSIGAEVTDVLCVIDRSENGDGSKKLSEKNLKLSALLTAKDIL